MTAERRLRIIALLGGTIAPGQETRRLCDVSAELLAMTGAGIMLMSHDVPTGSVCTTNSVSALIEELQFTLGEGPCVDAYNQERPVLEPDLVNPVTPRWSAFSGPVLAAGVRAVFGFPLQIGAVRLGALNLYRDQPGPLSDDQHADALVMADVVTRALLAVQANAPPGELAAELEANADFQLEVHQAAGMVSAQLGVSVGQALIRLRAHAFANGRALAEVAEDVLARRLRFDPADDEKNDQP